MSFLKFLQALANAPIATVMILLCVTLVVFAAAGKAPKVGRFDGRGRVLVGSVGVVLLVVGCWLAIAMSGTATQGSVSSSGLATPPHGASTPTPAILPAPTAAPEAGKHASTEKVLAKISKHHVPAISSPTPVVLESGHIVAPPKYVEWGCEESTTGTTSFTIPPGKDFVSADLALLQIDKAKTYQVSRPVYDAATRTVAASATFRGLDRFLLNCAGGGHATLQLRVTVR